jgi:hypothetical protein
LNNFHALELLEELLDTIVTVPLGDVRLVMLGIATNDAADGVTELLADEYAPWHTPATAATRNV